MEPLGKDRAKRLAKLLNTKGRKEAGKIILDSVPLIEEGLNHGLLEEVIFVADTEHRLLDLAAAKDVTCTPCSPELFPKLCDVKTSVGIVAIARKPSVAQLLESSIDVAAKKFVVYLDHIADPGNLGTIARSVGAFGCDLILLSPDCTDAMSPKCLRASAGALLKIEIAIGMPTPEHDWPIFYRATARGGIDVAELELPQRRALWLGNESHGPRSGSTDIEVVDVTIPMHADTESLNVTAAAAILASQFSYDLA